MTTLSTLRDSGGQEKSLETEFSVTIRRRLDLDVVAQ